MDDSNYTLRTLWDTNARWGAGNTALVMGDTRVTFGDLVARARRLGSALQQLGLRSQDRVGILAMNCLRYIEVYAANECAGFITSTVNFRLAGPEIAYIISDATPRVVFFEAQYAAMLDSLRGQLPSVKTWVCLDEPVPAWARGYEAFLDSGDPQGATLPPPAMGDVAHLIYTSGTTGRPKGCMLSHEGEVAVARAVAEPLQMSANTRTLLMMPFFHVGAKALQMAQHRLGGQVHVHRTFDIDLILDTIERERITHLHFAPVMLQALIEHPDASKRDLSSLCSILYSAAPMSQPVLKRGLELLGPIFVQQWGQTEGSGTVLPEGDHRLTNDPRLSRRLTSIGHPAVGIGVRVVDEEDQDVPLGQPGELLVRGRTVMLGYWNNSAATIETLRGGWLHTGDVCTQDEDGYLYLVDRKKDVIISGGENIYSREVEVALATHPAVQESAVIGVPHPKWGEAVCAVVMVRPGHQPTPEELVAHCRSSIAGYKRPRYIVLVKDLPRLPSGKISKVELRKSYGQAEGLTELL